MFNSHQQNITIQKIEILTSNLRVLITIEIENDVRIKKISRKNTKKIWWKAKRNQTNLWKIGLETS